MTTVQQIVRKVKKNDISKKKNQIFNYQSSINSYIHIYKQWRI